MKVFWVLAYDQYYPNGGLSDVAATFATLEEAEEYAKTLSGRDYVEVHDVSYLLGVKE